MLSVSLVMLNNNKHGEILIRYGDYLLVERALVSAMTFVVTFVLCSYFFTIVRISKY